ncbi:hypothetical protein NC652_015228 [Populus alba x Populus x berolinensis]|nr:hypothetical protein NC652_015228 [Populus alba x Populus x berolinensis]
MVLDFSFYNNHRIKKDDSGIVRNCCWTTYREFWPNKNPAQINHIQSQFKSKSSTSELDQIIEAFAKFLDESWSPKFTVLISCTEKSSH